MYLVNGNPRPFNREQLRALLLSHKLIEAAQIGNFAVVSRLVERHFTPVNNQNCDEGTTALAAAVVGSYFNIVKYLVEHGADVNIANLRGETPLHLAVLSDNVDIISFLLNEGSWIESEDECCDTPLMYATREDNSPAVEVLLMHGADPDHPNEDGETPYMLAEEVASDFIKDLLVTYAGRDASNAAESMVPDGNASGALGTSFDMKVHFSVSNKGLKSEMSSGDFESSSSAEEAALHISGNGLSSATASLKHSIGAPTVIAAGLSRRSFVETG